jgi:hypothetical protein
VLEILHNKLDCNQYGVISQLAHQYEAWDATIRRWHRTIHTAPDSTAWQNRCGEHLRIITDEQEKDLEHLIMGNQVDKHRLLKNDDFRKIAIEFWLQIASAQGSEEAEMDCISQHLFSCSDGFIADFKGRLDMSSRRSRFTRRPDADVVLMSNWVTHTTNYLAEKPRQRIINYDETCSPVFPANLLTWASKGAESVCIVPEREGKQKELRLMFMGEGRHELSRRLRLVMSANRLGQGTHDRICPRGSSDVDRSYLII